MEKADLIWWLLSNPAVFRCVLSCFENVFMNKCDLIKFVFNPGDFKTINNVSFTERGRP